jgi:hypothetical protein
MAGCCLSVASLALQLWLAPYREAEANLLKALVDAQIALTFLVSFILRVLASDTDAALNLYDPFDTPGRAIECYGWLLLVSMLLVVVTGVALTGRQSCKNRKRLGTIPLTDALFSLNLDPALHPDAAAALRYKSL